MAVENLKSAAITNSDATPVVLNTAGDGAAAVMQTVSGFATVSAAASVGSTYQLVRVPTKARMKHLFWENEAQGAGKVWLSAYYSDSAVDGTPAAKLGTLITAGFFSGDIDMTAAVASADYINGTAAAAGTNPVANRNKQLWDALGLASDPGGFIDIVAVVHTTAVTTGTGKINATAEYTA